MSNQLVKEKADNVRAVLERMKPQLALALPHHLTPERLLRVTMTAVQNSPKLLDCDRTSLFAAVMTCAQLGLEPDGTLGQAYLVPYGKRVQFIPGYKGFLSLARNSGEISTIQAHAVHENDHFDYGYGLNERLDHKPAEGDRGEITYFYAYAKYKDGGHIFEVMSKSEVDAVRDNSDGFKAFKAGRIKSNPWDSHYAQMGRKTAIRRLANYLPLNVQRAAALDAAVERGASANVDRYGEMVIEGEATGVEEDEIPAGNSATSKLDRLASGGSKPAAESKDKPPTMTAIKKAIAKCDNVDAVNEQLDLSRHLSEDQQKKVKDAAKKKFRELLPQAESSSEAESDGKDPGDTGLFGED